MSEAENVLYWDASAVISTLVRDAHSDNALAMLKPAATHLISTLAHAEICAVIARLFHSGSVDRIIVQGILNEYNNGSWQEIMSQPDREILETLAMKVSLRGADLWHIACVSALRKNLPELALISYDTKMRAAADILSIPLTPTMA